jgi:hypothetical protein
MKNIIFICLAGILVTACGSDVKEQPEVKEITNSKFYKIDSVGNSKYEFYDFATDLSGTSAGYVKVIGKTTEYFGYLVECEDTKPYSVKYVHPFEGEPVYSFVKGSSMYNISKSICWMHYLAKNEINYTQYLSKS